MLNESSSTLRSEYLLPALRREKNPSEAEFTSLTSTGLRPRYFAKGDKKNVRIGIALVNNKTIKFFNKKFLKITENTDVISFNINEDSPDGFYLLGDILVSLDQVKKQANHFNATEAEELARVVAHGVLHLLGYEDKTDKEQEKMRKLEDNIVSKIVRK